MHRTFFFSCACHCECEPKWNGREREKRTLHRVDVARVAQESAQRENFVRALALLRFVCFSFVLSASILTNFLVFFFSLFFSCCAKFRCYGMFISVLDLYRCEDFHASCVDISWKEYSVCRFTRSSLCFAFFIRAGMVCVKSFWLSLLIRNTEPVKMMIITMGFKLTEYKAIEKPFDILSKSHRYHRLAAN